MQEGHHGFPQIADYQGKANTPRKKPPKMALLSAFLCVGQYLFCDTSGTSRGSRSGSI